MPYDITVTLSKEARYFSQHAYRPVCAPCGKTPSECTCAPEGPPAALGAIADVVLNYRPKSKQPKPKKRKKAKRARTRRL